MADHPSITFFCELESEPLQDLFSHPGRIDQLKRLNARVSLGLMDASPERADVVRRLNQAGVAVTAWLLLPKDQGYWFNLDNAERAAARYAQFKAWSELRGLRWAAVGLDIEMDIRLMQAVAVNKLRGAALMVKTLAARDRYLRGAAIYRALVRQIQADGFWAESYQFPIITDEREQRSQLLQRLLGIVDLSVDREVLMLYTSFFPPLGAGMLAVYGPGAGGIGLGSTGGGVTMEGMDAPAAIAWHGFERDLLLAHAMDRPIYVFSLEGCVQQGFLDRLEGFDWRRRDAAPLEQVNRVQRYRRLLRGVLRFSRLFVHNAARD